ncbi:MAG: gluconate 2-dehydrogenase subunit 3 family protein [Burkholderiales bacterium]|nr:gluconate 2-dehydrogenase subunit 3 family protein [Burkholderiales bacterium]
MSDTSAAPAAPAPPPFTAAERAILDALMDLMIPASPDGRMPSAQSLALYAQTAGLTAAEAATFRGGLADLDARAQAARGAGFAALDPAAAQAIVAALRAERSAFLHAFTLHTAARYLAHDAVMPLIGLEPRASWPRGHAVAEGDWSLIEVVRARPRLYRAV